LLCLCYLHSLSFVVSGDWSEQWKVDTCKIETGGYYWINFIVQEKYNKLPHLVMCLEEKITVKHITIDQHNACVGNSLHWGKSC